MSQGNGEMVGLALIMGISGFAFSVVLLRLSQRCCWSRFLQR